MLANLSKVQERTESPVVPDNRIIVKSGLSPSKEAVKQKSSAVLCGFQHLEC